jgi:predicted aspartyl protease
MERAALILLALLAGCLPQSAAMQAAEAGPRGDQDLSGLLLDQGYREIPMSRLATGHFTIGGTAGEVSLDLIIDTGASHTMIDTGRAGRFDLALENRGSRATGLGGSSQRVDSGRLEGVSFGAMRFDTLRVAVTDLSHVNELLRTMGNAPVDGIIGADVLMQQRAVIDYGSLNIYFLEEE